LLKNHYNLDAMYLGGYTIECTLKALILELTPDQERAAMSKTLGSGSRMHNAEILGGILKGRGRPLPLELIKRFRRFPWSTELRYQAGRTDTGETRGFLITAKRTYDWVEGQLP
jgi:hypothetical protein